MFCGYCGKQIADGSLFCVHCGKSCASGKKPAEAAADSFNRADAFSNSEFSDIPSGEMIDTSELWENVDEIADDNFPDKSSDFDEFEERFEQIPVGGTPNNDFPGGMGIQQPQENFAPGNYSAFGASQAAQGFANSPSQTPPAGNYGQNPVNFNAQQNGYSPMEQNRPQYARTSYQSPDGRAEYGKAPSYRDSFSGEAGSETSEPRSAGLKVLTVFLCLFLFLFSSAACISGILRSALDDGNLDSSVKKQDFSAMAIRADELDARTFSDFLYKLCELEDGTYFFSKGDVKKILADDTFKSFLSEKYVSYKNDLLDGNDLEAFEFSEIADWLYDNGSVVKRITGEKLDFEDYESIKKNFEDYKYEEIKDFTMEDILGFSSSVVNYSVSTVVYIVLIVLSVGMIALIFVCNGSHLSTSFTCTGLTSIVVGIGLLALFGAELLVLSSDNFISGVILSSTLVPSIIRCSAAIAIGLILVIVSIILGKKKKRKVNMMR